MDAHTAPTDWISLVQTRAHPLDTEAHGRLEHIEDWAMRLVLLAGAVALGCVLVTAVALLAWG